MRIISKFQDYYDGVQAYGHDENLCYIRNKREEVLPSEHAEKFNNILELCPKFLNGKYSKGWNPESCDPDPFVIGFCGKFFAGARVPADAPNYLYPISKWDAFYQVRDVETHLSSIKDRKVRESQLAYFHDNVPRFYTGGKYKTRAQIFDRYFSKVIADGNELFFEFDSPVFAVELGRYKEPSKLIMNPCLTDYGFVKVFDPYSTFQEIDMYLGGVLGVNEPDTVEISDLKMRDKKGFDDYSFKKLPTKSR